LRPSLILSVLSLAMSAPPAPAARGDFALASTSPEMAGDLAHSVASATSVGDSRQDLAVANFGSNNVTILVGDGGGDFKPVPTSPEAVGKAPTSVAAGDFSGDGRQDLAVANFGSDNVTVLNGGGSGDVTPALSSPEAVDKKRHSVAVGDFDGDGFPDLATANFSSKQRLDPA
jgi:FG-GAP-like repeat